MVVDQFFYLGTAVLRETKLLSRIRHLHVYLLRNPCCHVEQQFLLWRFIHHLRKITPNYHGQLLQNLANMQLAWQNPLLRTGCCWFVFFCQGLLGHSLQNALWLSPAPSQNFGGTFAKIPLELGSRKASLLETWWCIWSLFLEASVKQYQQQVQGCASRPWYLAATYEGKGKCAVPFSFLCNHLDSLQLEQSAVICYKRIRRLILDQVWVWGAWLKDRCDHIDSHHEPT